MNFFPKEQFLFIDGEGFINNPYKELKKVESFLNLTSFFTTKHFYRKKYKKSSKKGFYCIKRDLNAIDKNIRCMGSSKGRKHPFIAKNTLKKMHKFYKPMSIELFEMIKKKPFWNIL